MRGRKTPVSNAAATPSRTLPLAAALKDATLSGLVAFGLFFFMIGLRTEQGPSGALEITTRFQTFAILVAVVFAGSFLRTLVFGRGPILSGRAVPPAITSLLAERAREEGIERFTALLLASNDQMHDVLATLGPAKVISRDAGTVVVEVAIPERGIGEHMAGVLRVAAGGTVELATPPWGLRRSDG